MSETTQAPKTAGHRVVGTVLSNKADKTITVLVERRERHPPVGKVLPFLAGPGLLYMHELNCYFRSSFS